MTRALGISLNLGRATGGANPANDTPLVVMGANTVAWYRSDLGITIGTGVSSWADQSGNGNHLTQGTGANQPTYNATGGPSSRPSLLFDGTNDLLLNAALNLPAPGTTPTFYWGVFRQVTWVSTKRIMGAGTGSAAIIIFQTGVSPALVQFNTSNANSNSGLATNTYGRLEALFNNAATDYLKLGSTSQTGANAGNTDPNANFVLGADGAGSFPANVEYCEFAIFNVNPSAGQKTSLDAYVTSLYGAGLV